MPAQKEYLSVVPLYRPQNTIILNMGTPKMVPLILGKPQGIPIFCDDFLGVRFVRELTLWSPGCLDRLDGLWKLERFKRTNYSAGAARLPIWLRLRLLGGGADRAHYAHQAPPMHRIFQGSRMTVFWS